MTYVIAQPCVDLKDKACIEECPVDCIYEGKRMLYIHPDECVDCGACEPVCPVEAIFYEDDTPEQWKDYYKANVEFFDDLGSPGRRRQARRDRQGPPAHRGAAAAGARRVTDRDRRDRRLGAGCPDFPWDPLAPYAERARRASRTGIVDLSVGTPVDPTPDGRPARRCAAAVRRARLPADRRARRRCARRSPTGSPAAAASPGSTSTACCRRSAPRSWSPGCRPCSGSAPGDVVVVPGLAYPTYDVGRPARRRRRRSRADALTAARPGTRVRLVWLNSPSQPDRPGAAASSTCARSSPGPASAAPCVASDECYARAAAGTATAGARSCTPTSAAASTTGCSRSTRCPSSPTSPATGRRSSPATRRWSRELLEVRKHAGMIVPGPVQARDGGRARRRRARRRAAASATRAPARDAARRRSRRPASGSTTPRRPLPLGDPRTRTAGTRVDWLAERGILVAPGDFYGPAGARHVRVALTATDERIAAAAAAAAR